MLRFNEFVLKCSLNLYNYLKTIKNTIFNHWQLRYRPQIAKLSALFEYIYIYICDLKIDNNVKNLKKQHNNLRGGQTTRVYSLIDLYGKGNIHNINTLRYEINKLLTPTDSKLENQLKYLSLIHI